MARAATPTTDHREIRRWAEAHGGHPAAVKGTGRGNDPGILRIDFPGFSGEESLREISWDRFFKWFDINELALIHRERDRFNKLVSRKTGAAQRRRAAAAAKSPAQRAAATRKRVAERAARGARTAASKAGSSRSSKRAS